ncbi:hypothetical protein K458DRAFT_384700 [Lentithecium fluviatile CBS 122367]|uniref:Uncharacterized protein n=1 Tax=Lentithecium fluviatile CBS 122367 TaxID=1168545 RepID=A0A6G1JDK1_9PLEO|nr:hypothetical protein K458DRAFT_384700 [Lentithecium fluviatile CBS 122367]
MILNIIVALGFALNTSLRYLTVVPATLLRVFLVTCAEIGPQPMAIFIVLTNVYRILVLTDAIDLELGVTMSMMVAFLCFLNFLTASCTDGKTALFRHEPHYLNLIHLRRHGHTASAFKPLGYPSPCHP